MLRPFILVMLVAHTPNLKRALDATHLGYDAGFEHAFQEAVETV
jgi:hypothetical protein